MSGAATRPELALISDSVENANARIRYFRVAFGAASPGQRLRGSEIRAILVGLLAGQPGPGRLAAAGRRATGRTPSWCCC